MTVTIVDREAAERSPCWDCKYRTARPGSTHISCGRAFKSEGNPLHELAAIFASVGRMAAPPPTEPIDFDVEMTWWPRCGSWPSSFDENIVLSCTGTEASEPSTARGER